ncbi:hypothetical protein A9G41_00240 [Gilliamella sp. Nev5-1]|uniref:DUF4261 domain-containing protein n=1 Tax=unclassified Gilliamella TaxID=2685620 RepID=UPI00080ECA4F|nr:DUF4261 domain-containing protein [Gilliamella apicola]OCG60726.1 hypothetical protein A9G40_03355 [Gilliamella apicola]OCG70309.1 hypothetical protein A9G41_00240 [Gilliamella apicola]
MPNAKCQMPYGKLGDGCYALFEWENHVIKLIGINALYPADVLEICVAPAHYSQDIKDQVRENNSYIILYYTGYEKDILEQYVALTQFAVGFEHCDMSALINAKAHQILATHVASALANEQKGVYLLRNCLPLFFIGFVKFNVDRFDGVWMRTYGADVFGLPDLAILANSHEDSEKYMNMFNNLLLYLRDSGASIQAGHTTEDTEGKKMLLRSPSAQESFLQNGGMVLVMEYLVE